LQAVSSNFYDNFIRKQSVARARLKQYMQDIYQADSQQHGECQAQAFPADGDVF
jgi:hypothetical protein